MINFAVKLFTVIISLMMLTACNFEGMYQKIVPENVKALDVQYVDALMEKDKTPFLHLQGEMSDEEFDQAFLEVFKGVPAGEVVKKSVAGFNHKTSIGTEKKSKTIASVFEIEKGEGYSLVTLNYSLDETGNCCELVYLSVVKHDTSPVIEGLKRIGLFLKIVGVLIFFSIVFSVFFVVRKIRRESQSKSVKS